VRSFAESLDIGLTLLTENSDKEEEAAKPVKVVKSKWEGEDEEEQVAVCTRAR
jgi:hypothetical protein